MMPYFQAMPYIRLSLLIVSAIFLLPFLIKIRIKSLKTDIRRHHIMFFWTILILISLVTGIFNQNFGVYYITDFGYVFFGGIIYLALNQVDFKVNLLKIRDLMLVIFAIDFFANITPSIYLVVLSVSFLFLKNTNLFQIKTLLNLFFTIKYSLDINRTIFVLVIIVLILIILKKTLKRASGFFWIITIGLFLSVIFFYDVVLEQLIYVISEKSRIGLRLKQLLDFLQGNVDYNSSYFISITQRIQEAQLVLLSWTDSICSFLFGEGSGATIDGTKFQDQGVLQSSLTGHSKIHNIHILPFSLILRYGLGGVILFYFLLKESIRFFVRYFFSKHTPKYKPKTIYAVYVCILIIYSMPAGSTLWADQLFFIFLALNKKQDYKTLDG